MRPLRHAAAPRRCGMKDVEGRLLSDCDLTVQPSRGLVHQRWVTRKGAGPEPWFRSPRHWAVLL